MISGLRSHWKKTIPCVSLRSGIASSGRWPTDQMPATTAQAARINTRKRLRAENSMTRSIMTLARGRNGHCRTRPQAALRIDQERARGYDAFTGLEAIENFHAVAPALADPHRAALQITVTAIDVRRLLQSEVHHGIGRHHELAGRAHRELHIDKHLRLQLQVFVGDLEPHLGGTRLRVHLRLNVSHAGGEAGRFAVRAGDDSVLALVNGRDV